MVSKKKKGFADANTSSLSATLGPLGLFMLYIFALVLLTAEKN